MPPDWQPIIEVRVDLATPVWLPGTLEPLINLASLRTIDGPALLQAPVRPRLGPPREVSIAERPADQIQQGVGLTPTLRWSAPSIGRPTGYFVFVRGLEAQLESVVQTTAGTIVTQDPEVTFPPGMLRVGQWYRVEIVAQQSSAPSQESAWRQAWPLVEASHFTGAFTP